MNFVAIEYLQSSVKISHPDILANLGRKAIRKFNDPTQDIDIENMLITPDHYLEDHPRIDSVAVKFVNIFKTLLLPAK